MADPKITVLMPAYNAGKYIHEAISSVLQQSFDDFELLIVNDGSTDDTLAVIQSFHDERIVMISQRNKGVAAALNLGLQYARAPYIARFDADDICYPERLQVQYNYIMSHPDYSIIGSAVDYVTSDGEYIFSHKPDGYSYDELKLLNYRICPFIHSSVLYKKEAVVRAGGYNEYAYTFEDHLLWANILDREKACNLKQPLIKVRLNPDSVTIDEKWRTPRFRKLKYEAIKYLQISKADGTELMRIGMRQKLAGVKQASYHAMLGKKYLWNNYQPTKARQHLLKTAAHQPLNIKNYALWLLSFFSEKALSNLYHFIKGDQKPAKTAQAEPVIIVKELNYGS